jgi:hypothetical protein
MNKCVVLIMFSSILLYACEGFKYVTIQNVSSEKAFVTIKSKSFYDSINDKYLEDPIKFLDSSKYTLEVDSSVDIQSNFTAMMSMKLEHPSDLTFDYLRIESIHDTIIAHSKFEILELLAAQRKDESDKKFKKGNYILVK